jgi:hypothetical protein
MNYLDPSEFENYGLEETTLTSWVTIASALIDAHCRRETLSVQHYTERRQLNGSSALRLTYLPLATVSPAASPLVSMRVRYRPPRHGESAELSSTVGDAFGLFTNWTAIGVEGLDVDSQTGEVALPIHALGLAYNEVEVTYTAGLESIPAAVKCACAQLVRNAQATPALNVRASGIDRMHMEYFRDTLMDDSVRKMLAPYVAQKVG